MIAFDSGYREATLKKFLPVAVAVAGVIVAFLFANLKTLPNLSHRHP
jgi:hypothetical protein